MKCESGHEVPTFPRIGDKEGVEPTPLIAPAISLLFGEAELPAQVWCNLCGWSNIANNNMEDS